MPHGPGMEQRYVVHGTPIVVGWEDAAVGAAVEEVLRHFGLDVQQGGARSSGAARALALRLRFEAAEAPAHVPAGAVRAARYEEAGISAWRAGTCLYLKAGGGAAVLRLGPARGTGRGQIAMAQLTADGAIRQAITGLLVLGLFALLRARGLFPLHAAALAKGSAEDDAGVLLVGPSDSGKSTLAYSLVRRGWRHVSDDSVLLRAEGGARVEALAFRRTFALDFAAQAIFPELHAARKVQMGPEEKWTVALESVYPAQAAARCAPHVLVLPEIADQPASEIAPARAAEALRAVAGQSALLTLEPQRAAAHMEALARLVGQARCYRLRAGRDLIDDPARAASLLEPLFAASCMARS